LLDAALGGGPAGQRSPEFFRWKHHQNPFGQSFMLVAESAGQLIGLRAFLRWRFEGGGRSVQAVRAVDTATHSAYRGMGVFSRLTRTAVEELRGQVELVFNTPNSLSRPGYLKLGWHEVGRVPVAIQVRRPLRMVRSARARTGPRSPRPEVAAQPAARVLERGEQVARLLARSRPANDGRLRTSRDVEYLRWRYGLAPLLGYAAVTEDDADGLRGLAIFRVRPRGGLWESTVAEVLVSAGDRSTARRLLRRVAAAAPVDHLTVHLGDETASGARRRLLPALGGIGLVVNPLSDDVRPDPGQLRSWALSLGDLEVF
jgi:GNAT superfamily N-acetyltransferase